MSNVETSVVGGVKAKIGAAIMVGAVSALVVNTLPVFLTVLARGRGLDEAQSGLVAFADLGGIAIGTILCALLPDLVRKLNWRRLAALGLAILVVANLLSIIVSYFPAFMLVRLMAGIGGGMALAVTYAVLAEYGAARYLALFNVAQMGSGWLGIPLLGPLADNMGVGALYGAIAAISAVAMIVSMLLPGGRNEACDGAGEGAVPDRVSREGWLAIGGVFLYFFGAGSVFAFLAFMGMSWGGEAQAVEGSLSTIMFAAMVGAITVALIGSRFGFKKSLYISYATLLGAILLLAFIQPVENFVLFGCLFGFAWNLLTPYQFEAVTQIDDSSSAAMLVNASTLGGIAVGPAIAGFMVSQSYIEVNIMGFFACLASLCLLVLAWRMHGAVQKVPE